MNVKNLNIHPPLGDLVYGNLKKRGNYGFPHSVKYVAWFIVVAVIISSSAAQIMYGFTFRTVQTYYWITAFLTLFFIGIFAIMPVRIFTLDVINSVFFKGKPVMIKRKITPSLFLNPSNQIKKNQVLKYRNYNANLYNPLPFYKQQSRLEDIRYNLEMRHLTVDIFVYLVFLMTALYIVLISKPSMGFYSNEMILELISKGTHKDSVPFKEITTYEKLLKYVNETLLPALLPNSVDIVSNNKSYESFRRNVHMRNLKLHLHNLTKRQIIDELNIFREDNEKGESNFGRGWTLNPNLKLMGKPRLRQTRVKTGICKELINLKATDVDCAAELTLFNVETGDFSLKWDPPPPERLTESQAYPWNYQSAWKTATQPIFAKFSTYPAGGFVLELARNIDDTRTILQFFDTFQWIDFRTRAVFIEFTIYCVNTNLFHVVTLIAEQSATGYIIPSYQISTCKFLISVEIEYIIISVLFALFLIYFLLREILRISKTSFKQYLSRDLGLLDLAVILLGILCLVFTIFRSIYVCNLLEELEKTENDKFVSFIHAAFWYSWSLYIESLLLCLISFKFLRLLTHRVVFFKLQMTLNLSYRHFIDLITTQVILITAFAFLFSLTFAAYSEGFRNFGSSFLTLIGLSVALDGTLDLETFSNNYWFLAPLYFGLFVILMSILIVNVFVAVICFYYQKIQNIPLAEKYYLFEYMKHLFTINRQKDLFHQKEEKIFLKKALDPDVMRLKGGGKKPVKSEKKVKCQKGKKRKGTKPKTGNCSERTAILMKNFLVEKPYDMTMYCDLTEYRAEALRNLMVWVLAVDENIKNVARENAMKALFLSSITDKAKLQENFGKYFLVNVKSKTEVSDKDTLLKMRKVVENMGKEKQWIVNEDICEEEVSRGKSNFTVLERKLRLLIDALDED